MATKPKRPRDPFQLAKLIGDISTGQVEDTDPNVGKNPAAVALGKLGGVSWASLIYLPIFFAAFVLRRAWLSPLISISYVYIARTNIARLRLTHLIYPQVN